VFFSVSMQGADVVFGVDPGAGSHVPHYIELQIKTEKSRNMEQLSGLDSAFVQQDTPRTTAPKTAGEDTI
jgi:hypothetical protein